MEPRDLARTRETSVAAPKAPRPSLATWRCGPRPRTPTLADQLTIRAVSGREASHSGQRWQENGGGGRSQIIDPPRETSAGRASINRGASKAGQKRLDPEDHFR